MSKAKADEKKINSELRKVYNSRTKSEKLSWGRKRKAIEVLIDSLEEFDKIIMEQYTLKQPILDKINKKKKDMKKDCVHPRDMLIHKGNIIECKFCYTKIKLNVQDEEG